MFFLIIPHNIMTSKNNHFVKGGSFRQGTFFSKKYQYLISPQKHMLGVLIRSVLVHAFNEYTELFMEQSKQKIWD